MVEIETGNEFFCTSSLSSCSLSTMTLARIHTLIIKKNSMCPKSGYAILHYAELNMADVWENSMACHPRATYHTAGCCHLVNSLSRLQSHMPHCRVQSPGEINVMIVPHCRM